MFVKRCARNYKGKVYESFWLVEAYREKGKIKHRYIVNLDKLSPDTRNKLKEVLANPKAVVVEDMSKFFVKGYNYGEIVFFLYIMHKLGVIRVLKERLSKKALSLIVAVLLNRILKPSSKMGAIAWIKDTSFPFFSSLKDKDYHHNFVYLAMDEVDENMEGIEEGFYRLSGGKPMFLLYDITSAYFEGNGTAKGKRGYSRDRRPDRPQVLLGVVLNEDGFPLHFDIFDGNTRDSKTVIEVAKKVKERFGIEKAIFVGDRGMITVENIKELTSEHMGLGYIMALRHEEAKELFVKKNIQLELFDKQLPVTIYQEDGKNYVLCGSEYRKARDEATLMSLIKRGEEALGIVKRMVDEGKLKDYEKVIRRAQKKLTESGACRYLDFEYRDGEFKIIKKEEEIERAKILCGHYVLETSEIDMEEERVEAYYKELQQVERCFRDLKEFLEIRPIYHWLDKRVKVHIFCCIVAQVVLSYVRKGLKANGWLGKENTLEKFINLLSSVKLGKFLVERREVLQVQQENPVEEILLKAFKLLPFDYERDKGFCSI